MDMVASFRELIRKGDVVMKRLEGKIAIITGSNSGIGKTTAEMFAREGATVVLTARRLDLLEQVAEICRGFGVEALAIQADVSKHEDCTRVVEETVKAFGRIDILVNNAGIADKQRPITECSDEWWDHVVAVDQSSVFYMCKETLKYMEPAGYGSIINISSIGGVFGVAGISYSAAKSALLGMTKNIAIQYAGLGIRCNAVCPGPTPTSLNTQEEVSSFTQWFADVCAAHMDLTRPAATTEDQANAILFFASDESKALTGQILIVDNGATL
jgi:NAD(P)-dependent dehydrogenase (short-subunit alcohol dehydrogenase family)